MQGLDLIFSKPSNLKVLRILYTASEPLTGREIQRRTGLSNRATMMALESLGESYCIHYEETASANWYEINKNHYFFTKAIKPCFEAEDSFWEDLRKTVRRCVKPRAIAAVVTGPMARDESLSEGRLEITLLFLTGRNRVRAYQSIPDLQDEILDRYALPLHATLLDMNNMDAGEYDTLWKRVAREGILLFGTLP